MRLWGALPMRSTEPDPMHIGCWEASEEPERISYRDIQEILGYKNLGVTVYHASKGDEVFHSRPSMVLVGEHIIMP